MFNRSTTLCTYMQLFNDVMLVHAMTAILIILNSLLFLSRFVKTYM